MYIYSNLFNHSNDFVLHLLTNCGVSAQSSVLSQFIFLLHFSHQLFLSGCVPLTVKEKLRFNYLFICLFFVFQIMDFRSDYEMQQKCDKLSLLCNLWDSMVHEHSCINISEQLDSVCLSPLYVNNGSGNV